MIYRGCLTIDKCTELTVAFKTLQKKTMAVEQLLTEHTGIKTLSSTNDIEALRSFFLNASETKKSLDLGLAERQSLLSKISDLQAIQALEAETKATLYAALQKEILDKDAVRCLSIFSHACAKINHVAYIRPCNQFKALLMLLKRDSQS